MSAIDKIKISMARLTSQKDLVGWLIKYGVVLVVFLAIFIPLQKQLSTLSTGKASLATDVENLKKITDSLMKPEEAVLLKERLDLFEKRIVSTQDANKLIALINAQAEKHHLSVIQIYSDSPVSIKDDQNIDLEYEGNKLSLLPVNFRLEADYKNLGEFLFELREDANANFVVESIQIQRSATQAEGLQCDIILGFVAK